MTAVCLDYIVCTGRNGEESRANQITVLRRLQTANLRLKLDKCDMHLSGSSSRCWRNSSYKWEGACDCGRTSATRPQWTEKLPRNGMLLPQFSLSAKLPPCIISYRRTSSVNKRTYSLQPSMSLLLMCDSSAYGIGALLSHRLPDGTDRPISICVKVAEKVSGPRRSRTNLWNDQIP